MSAETLKSIRPANNKMVERAQSENMNVSVKVANGETAELAIENVEKDSKYTMEVEGNIPVHCSCKAFQYHCDESNSEVCKHMINYSVKAP